MPVDAIERLGFGGILSIASLVCVGNKELGMLLARMVWGIK